MLCREQIAMSRGLTDVPLVVVGNKTDLLSSRDMALDKFRHDVVNKVGRRDHLTTRKYIISSAPEMYSLM